MSDAQWRVLGLLLAAAAINAVYSPSLAGFGKMLKGDFSGVSTAGQLSAQLAAPAYAVIGVTVGALALLLLADAATSLATLLAVIILTTVVLRHGADLARAATQAQAGLATLTGKGA